MVVLLETIEKWVVCWVVWLHVSNSEENMGPWFWFGKCTSFPFNHVWIILNYDAKIITMVRKHKVKFMKNLPNEANNYLFV
jgi:hypothetical protein